MIKIGFADRSQNRKSASALANSIGLESTEMIQLAEKESENAFQNDGWIASALNSGECDVVVYPLQEIPAHLGETLIIGGLGARDLAFDAIVYKPVAGAQGLIRLEEGARVLCYDGRSAALAADLFPKWHITMAPEMKELGVDFDQYNGFIMPAVKAHLLEKTDTEIFVFHPKEFVPGPGQNVAAWLCLSEHKELRKILKQHHHSEVSAATNVERKVARLLAGEGFDNIGVYCDYDVNGYYHVYVTATKYGNAGLVRKRISSSTSLELAEMALSEMLKFD